MSKNRPYFNSSSADLKDIANENKDNPEELKVILYELNHRKAKAAGELKLAIESYLEDQNGFIDETLPVQQNLNQESKKSQTPPSNRTQSVSDDGNDEPTGFPYDHRFSLIDSQKSSSSQNTKWLTKLYEDDDYKLNKDDELLSLYIDALGKHIDELKKFGRNNSYVDLIDGKRVHEGEEFNLYSFELEDPLELFEGASVEIFIANSTAKAKVSNLLDHSVVLEFDDNYGEIINSCTVKIDKTQLIRSLHEKLQNVDQGKHSDFNDELAEKVLTNSAEEIEPELEKNIIDIKELNAEQKLAVGKALSNEVTYIWGPPGTGKTRTLGVLIKNLFHKDERTLIASNTNQAVDQVLLKLCQELGRDHPALKDGKIIRRGKIDLQELKEEWGDLIDIDAIVDVKGEDLREKIETLNEAIDKLNKDSAKVEKVLSNFKALDEKEKNKNKALERFDELIGVKNRLKGEAGSLRNKISSLDAELNDQKEAGAFRKIILRSEAQIIFDIDKTNKFIEENKKESSQLSTKLKDQESVINALKDDIKHLKEIVKNKDRNQAQRSLNKINEKRGPLESELSTLRAELENLREKILDEAKILGATVTRSYLNHEEFSGIKNLIIDEASMVFLPALYYVVGLSSDRCVISGDFRQIAPIVDTKQKDLDEVLSRDIFDFSGIEELSHSGRNTKNLIMLKQQYRMQDNICNLINSFMYRGELVTADMKLNTSTSSLLEANSKNIIIIDTSRIFPFSQKKGTSYYNLMHAITVRNLVKQLKESFTEKLSIGICSPYAAQAKMHNSLNRSHQDITSGTVHRFQGDEKDLMIIDTVDSLGENTVGYWSLHDLPNEDGCRLWNVAISRSKDYLIFISNLTHLNKHLPKQSFLRSILYNAQKKGDVIDVHDLLELTTIEKEIQELHNEFVLEDSTLKKGLFSNADFEKVFLKDIQLAKESVAIFSGFITPARVAHYGEVFRAKISEGVKIRCVTRPPALNGNMKHSLGEEALNALEAVGCVVDTRGSIHQKAAIIDDEISWFGSLNPLSHTSKTEETMARIKDKKFASQLSQNLAIKFSKDTAGLSVKKENPECSACNFHRTSYHFGTYGKPDFWKCESCGSNTPVNQRKSKDKIKNKSLVGKACPTGCGGTIRIVNGRYGQFLSCTNWKSCNFKPPKN